jgi:hypothetical protein
MNPTLKKLIAAVAIKEGIERIQEMREPKKPSGWARFGKTLTIVGIGAGAYYAYKNGLFDGLIEQIKGKGGSDEFTYSPSRNVNVSPSDTYNSPEGTPTV